jgi:UDP-N-acetylmuramate-alanine ligase
VKVIDDFGHHPTAIAQTLTALRHRYRGHRIWAVFEPRSNTTRRAVFQQLLPDALKLADGVFISQVARLEQIPEDERLNPEAVVKTSRHPAGRPFTSRTRHTSWISSCRSCGRTTSSQSSATADSTASTRRFSTGCGLSSGALSPAKGQRC